MRRDRTDNRIAKVYATQALRLYRRVYMTRGPAVAVIPDISIDALPRLGIARRACGTVIGTRTIPGCTRRSLVRLETMSGNNA